MDNCGQILLIFLAAEGGNNKPSGQSCNLTIKKQLWVQDNPQAVIKSFRVCAALASSGVHPLPRLELDLASKTSILSELSLSLWHPPHYPFQVLVQGFHCPLEI